MIRKKYFIPVIQEGCDNTSCKQSAVYDSAAVTRKMQMVV